MVSNKKLKISIIIPAFNEESVLESCLRALAKQTMAPYEVIVVDNNSTDKTAEIIKKYPFVKMLKEKKQGIIAAHHKGFNTANGDVLARIDADTVVSKTWVERVNKNFVEDDELSALTGPGGVYEIAFKDLYPGLFFSKYYFLLGKKLIGFQLLWGSNMAIRKPMWDLIKNETCKDEKIVHDDVDISILIHERRGKIKYDPYLKVYIHGMRFINLVKVAEYHRKMIKTRVHHQKRGSLVI